VPVVDQVPNGARFQGLAVVPEPTAMMLVATASMIASIRRLNANINR
jgi:hypothetical protein